MDSHLHCLLLLLLLLGIVLSRPTMQRIVVNNHTWEVPNEPGWKEVLQEAESVYQLLRKCTTATECRQIVNKLRTIFYDHSVTRKYLESETDDADNLLTSIFKWG